MSNKMPKTYNPQRVERRLYEWWEKRGFFKPKIDWSKKPFVISMPPPNITGELHLGHAITASIQDLLIRYHRMKGDPTLWLPGSDHASIATHYVIERGLAARELDDLLEEIGYPLPPKEKGLTRWDLGREWFVKLGWAWKERYGGIIAEQHRRLGTSCDWTRERFTMDPGLSRAVREAFVRLFKRGLIYRGKYMINWCPRCGTALSDLEVEHREEMAKLWYVRYPLVEGKGHITVATTRPETILGDTAVAVHPYDERYADLVGRMAILPILGRHIPIIADEAVDREFGTGAVKVTPAHDPDDYEMGVRHNLPAIEVMNPDGTMNEEAGPYVGMDRYQCRQAILEDLRREGLLVKIENYSHALGHCQRCDTVVEPRLSEQWFVRMKPLAEPAIEAVRDGRIRIIPERFAKIYFHWMENIRDWCISRQLWWGHRIPVWYCDDCGELTVSVEDPRECEHCGSENIHQDPDVLDTWFSSALWPFSTLGWPEDTEEFRYFYPTTVMETGYDILFFWVARMIMMGLECTGQIPFRIVYLHGLIRDAQGRKMSKSLGNVINPLEVIEEYGTDALRFTLLTGSTPGNDMKLSLEHVEGARNFANKIWNAARFVLSQMTNDQIPNPNWSLVIGHWSLPERWILSRHNRVVADVTRLLDDFQFGEAGRKLYDFFWGEFCDWYIEISKIRLYGGDEKAKDMAQWVLLYVLERTMRLLHPFMPFITEEIWQHLRSSEQQAGSRFAESIMIAPWPEVEEALFDEEAEREMKLVMEVIRAIRNARAEYKVEPNRRIEALIAAGEKFNLMESQRDVLVALARLDPERLTLAPSLPQKPKQALILVVGPIEIYLPLAGMVDLEAERKRLAKEVERLEEEIARSERLLAKGDFLAKAPAEVVEREREKLADYREKRRKLRERLNLLEA